MCRNVQKVVWNSCRRGQKKDVEVRMIEWIYIFHPSLYHIHILTVCTEFSVFNKDHNLLPKKTYANHTLAKTLRFPQPQSSDFDWCHHGFDVASRSCKKCWSKKFILKWSFVRLFWRIHYLPTDLFPRIHLENGKWLHVSISLSRTAERNICCSDVTVGDVDFCFEILN